MVPGHLQKSIKEHTNAQPSCCCKLLDVHCKTPHASSQLEKQKLANPAVESPAPACLACTCCCGQRWSQGRSCLPCLYCAASLAFLLLCLAAALRIAARALAPARQRPKAGPPASKPADAERRPAPARARARRHRLQALLAAAGLWGRAWWAYKPPCKAGDSARRRRRLVCSLPARTNRKRPKRETKIKQQNNSN